MLLIACINYMNLTTARSARRAKEIGIRKVTGSSKKQLVLQFLSQRAGNLDAASLGQLLGQETASAPQPGGLAGGLLGGLLDQNGDGKLDAGDLFKLGAGLFSKR